MKGLLKYRIPLQNGIELYYYESKTEAEYSNVSLQFRINTFLKHHNISTEEQYPHLINNYVPEESEIQG
jgi:hypothetical protein